MAQRQWTLEQRLKQSQAIQHQRPWERSTGPKTDYGKMISSMNAYTHGARCAEIRNAERQLTEWKNLLNQIITSASIAKHFSDHISFFEN